MTEVNTEVPTEEDPNRTITSEVSRHTNKGLLASERALQEILLSTTQSDREPDEGEVLDHIDEAVRHHEKALTLLASTRRHGLTDADDTATDECHSA